MAKPQSHFSVSVGASVLYVLFGSMALNVAPEILFLAAVIMVIAGMLPNIDESQSGAAQEFGGLLAAERREDLTLGRHEVGPAFQVAAQRYLLSDGDVVLFRLLPVDDLYRLADFSRFAL